MASQVGYGVRIDFLASSWPSRGSGAHYPVLVWDRIAQALAEPLKALGVSPRMMHERGKLGDYVIAMIPPLMLLAEEWGRQFEWHENQPDFDELA